MPEASIWTLSGVLSMQPVHQHREPPAGPANKAWISREGCNFALTFKHTVAVLLLPSWFWSIFRTVWDSWTSFLRPKRVLPVATRCMMRIASLISVWVRIIVDNVRV